jgi:hypothetical protein
MMAVAAAWALTQFSVFSSRSHVEQVGAKHPGRLPTNPPGFRQGPGSVPPLSGHCFLVDSATMGLRCDSDNEEFRWLLMLVRGEEAA